MSSIINRMKKLTVQRDQHVNPWTGVAYSRAAANSTILSKRQAMAYRTKSAEEIRAERVWEAEQERGEREAGEQWRKTERPVYGKPIGKGTACSCYWVKRKTPDRAIRRMMRKSTDTAMTVRLLSGSQNITAFA